MKVSRQPHLKNLALFVLLIWIGTGCYVPIRQTPPESRKYYPSNDDFAPGETMRVDVLLTMGEPDEVSSDETILIYRWSTIDGIIIITQCTPPIELKSQTGISFTFDENGVLQVMDVSID